MIREVLPYLAAAAGAAYPLILVTRGEPSLVQYASRMPDFLKGIAMVDLLAFMGVGGYFGFQAARSLF